MTDNVMSDLKCQVTVHGDMEKLITKPTLPLGSPSFTLWVCHQCGVMALHLEAPGDIYWYSADSKSRDAGRGLGRHRAGCAYCPARFDCTCDSPGQRHMCPRCEAEAEESKMEGDYMGGALAPRVWPAPDPGEVAQDRVGSGPRYPEDLTSAETGAGSTDDF